VGISLGIAQSKRPLGPEELSAAAGMAALVSAICCTAAGALFGALAERRHRQLHDAEE